MVNESWLGFLGGTFGCVGRLKDEKYFGDDERLYSGRLVSVKKRRGSGKLFLFLFIFLFFFVHTSCVCFLWGLPFDVSF